MSKRFFTSDTHYRHKNIASHTCSAWESGYRDFESLDDHDQSIVKALNKYVAEDDELWHLGDWSFGGIENIWAFRKQLRCKHIHLILGNHDHHIEANKQLPNCKTNELLMFDVNKEGFNIKTYESIGHQNAFAQDLFEGVYHVYTSYLKGLPLFMSHYAHRIWNGSHKGFFHLYGHSHDTLEYEQWGRSMDVGVDAAYRLFGEYRPFTEDEVYNILSKRPIKFLDHHNANTNVK